MTGEVVDAWCYASQVMGSGRGEKHKACALACIHGGVSAGILDEKTGELFIAAKHKGYKGCTVLLLPLWRNGGDCQRLDGSQGWLQFDQDFGSKIGPSLE